MPINSFSPPRIVIDTNSPAHAESSPHVRRTLDINRESDIHAVAGTPQTPISIHALRKESDPGTLRLTKRSKNFNPHSPCEERLEESVLDVLVILFQSTLPLRGATSPLSPVLDFLFISIHALHEESDSAAGHFCPLFETQASCLALSISNNTADTTNNMSKTSNWLSVSF